MEDLNKVEYTKEGQEYAKRQLINILKRKGTIIWDYSMNKELRTYVDSQECTEIVLGGTVKMSIQLAYKKYKQE